jgi:hypothetical protein
MVGVFVRVIVGEIVAVEIFGAVTVVVISKSGGGVDDGNTEEEDGDDIVSVDVV